ncbi:hypothetical protein NECAME_03695 [Necator americanus]|uniref:Uncharacterized protein n=1 Tax=Necator americanus TaxID=51031 RepID=W2T1D5_NECAM|nr:hypothetical protein NECAME_03695 [Necator americanus]ETN75723.1 hypothetical protein NECAME_03695 [Necator americanus]
MDHRRLFECDHKCPSYPAVEQSANTLNKIGEIFKTFKYNALKRRRRTPTHVPANT